MLGTPPRPARSATTTAAGVVGIVLSALWSLFGLLLLVVAAVVGGATDGTENEDPFIEVVATGVGAALAVVGVLLLAFAAWSVVTSAQLVRRRRWARVATLITFSIWGALSVVFFVATLAGSGDDEERASTRFEGEETAQDDDTAGAVMWLVNAAACGTVIVLAAQRSVGEDIAAAEGGYGPNGVASPYGAPPPGYGAPVYGRPPAPGYGSPLAGGAPPPGHGAPVSGGSAGSWAPGPNPAPSWQPPPPPRPAEPQPPQDPFAPPGSPW